MAKLSKEAIKKAMPQASEAEIQKLLDIQSAPAGPRLRRMSFKADEGTIIAIAKAFPKVDFVPAYRWRKPKKGEAKAPKQPKQ
jgi:hypothetical protein